MSGPYVGPLRAAGLAKEVSLGTLKTPPDIYVPVIPPDSFYPSIALLESAGIRQLPDLVYKVAQGPGTLNGMKAKVEMEPEGGIGQFLMAATGTTDPNTGPTDTTVYTHTFKRAAVSQLPTYSWWFDKGAHYPQFPGCMLHKLDVSCKAGGFVECDTEWVGLKYDTTGTSKTPTYSALQPFSFPMITLTVGGSGVTLYDSIKITIDNTVKADHLFSGSIYPGVIYSAGLKVTLSADIVFQDTTEYTKFLNGSSTSFVVAITSTQKVTGSAATYYSLTLTIPKVYYNAAPIPIAKDLLKCSFSGTAVYDTSTTETFAAVLINGASAAY